MSERAVDNPFERQTITLKPTWDAYLHDLSLYTQDELTYDTLQESLERHFSQLRDLTQDFLGVQDIHNATVLAAFCITHINYCWRGIADQTARSRFAFDANPRRFAQKTIDTMEALVDAAKTGSNIDIIDSVYEYISSEIDLAVEETLDAFHAPNQFTNPAIDLKNLRNYIAYSRFGDR